MKTPILNLFSSDGDTQKLILTSPPDISAFLLLLQQSNLSEPTVPTSPISRSSTRSGWENYVSVYTIVHSFTHSSLSPPPAILIPPSHLLLILPPVPSNLHRQVHLNQSFLLSFPFFSAVKQL
ncbi:unnamed protein product [Microthlaspi erraticum]|uniref:Uncharacterized protein n=1 Tax=Microthlaspi erraticum TaxID=1685480 RepID=A0A6D2JX42_9BRAS|nr:unnamed protein product [Microthlaspi erraticum]